MKGIAATLVSKRLLRLIDEEAERYRVNRSRMVAYILAAHFDAETDEALSSPLPVTERLALPTADDLDAANKAAQRLNQTLKRTAALACEAGTVDKDKE